MNKELTLKDMISAAFEKRYKGGPTWRTDAQRGSMIAILESFYTNLFEGCMKDLSKTKKDRYTPVLRHTIDELASSMDLFVIRTTDGLQMYNRDKFLMAQKVKQLFLYLNDMHGTAIDMVCLDRFEEMSKQERQLRLLKLVHSGKTQKEMAEAMNISLQTAKTDLSALQDGMEFMGTTMQIVPKDDSKYGSTIHPIFLALNMSEIYSLTVGLKLLGSGTVFEESLSGIADKIYMQLSEYAADLVDEQSDQHHLCFEGQEMYFKSTKRLMDTSDKPFAYYLKENIKCRVICGNGQGPYECYLKLPSGYRGTLDKVVVLMDDGDGDGEEVELHMKDIQKIEKL